MENLITVSRAMAGAIDDAVCRLFAKECGIDRRIFNITFPHDYIMIEPRTKVRKKRIEQASELYRAKGRLLAFKCWEWVRKEVEIWSVYKNPVSIPASKLGLLSKHENHRRDRIMSEPIVAFDSIEIGAFSLTPEIFNRLEWMMKNPKPKTGIIRLHDEAQIILSASSAELLTTTTLKEAVQRKRSEFWHPHDLTALRIKTGEMVQELIAGTKTPEQTQFDFEWRCRSRTGKWRRFTVRYETFLTGNKIPYQFSENLGTEAIEVPSDIICVF